MIVENKVPVPFRFGSNHFTPKVQNDIKPLSRLMVGTQEKGVGI